jgi:hypothetical protein
MGGYERLKLSVEKDCSGAGGCFNPNGCDKPKGEPAAVRCSHRYCDKFAWVIARAKHYAEKTGLAWEEILDSWENARSYWYMNYYQDANQPEIGDGAVRVFETVSDLMAAIGSKGFRCPACGGVSSSPYECDSGLKGKDKKVCDWKVYGLFRDLGKGVFVYCKEKLHGERLFMPVAWES